MQQISEVISSVVSERPERTAVTNLIHESHRFALAYLWQKARQQHLLSDMFRLSMEDLALDCIADLFQRDDAGRFAQLVGYFGSIEWQKMDEEDLYIALRRLVFSKVNEGLFRRYREADPSLAKIIRNLKNAAKSTSGLKVERRKQEMWIIAESDDAESDDAEQTSLPVAPVEILEAHLISHLSNANCDTLRQVTQGFIEFVTQHTYYNNAFPLTSFAQIVRSAFVRIGEVVGEHEEEEVFVTGQVARAIDVVASAVQADMHASYVGKGKVDAATYEAYFFAVQDILASQFVNDAAPVDSYLEALEAYIPHLTNDAYRTHHRHILEYLVKISRNRLFDYLKDEIVH